MNRPILESWVADGPGVKLEAYEPATRRLAQRLYWTAGITLVLVVLAAAVPIEGAVIGSGQVASSQGVRIVSHPTGGIVGSVLVKDGDVVHAGQVLLRLDDTVGGAAAQSVDTITHRLAARRARLQAESTGASRFPSPYQETVSPEGHVEEARLFGLRRSALNEERQQIAAQSAQVGAQISGLEAQLATLRAEGELASGEREGIESLWERRLVTLSRLNQARRLTVEIEGRIAVAEASIREARMRQLALSRQDAELLQSRRATASAELADLELEVARDSPQNVAANERSDRRDVRAPVAGMVNRLAVRGAGQVVRPTETLLEIAPSTKDLIVEARITPTDIEQVHLGQTAIVKFPSLSRALTPQLDGKVAYISDLNAGSTAEGRPSSFLIRVQFEENASIAGSLPLRAGMPAEVFIRTPGRTLLSYLFRPLLDQFNRALRGD